MSSINTTVTVRASAVDKLRVLKEMSLPYFKLASYDNAQTGVGG